jgi:hypothetical protein
MIPELPALDLIFFSFFYRISYSKFTPIALYQFTYHTLLVEKKGDASNNPL